MDALSKIFDDIHLHQSEYIYLNPQGDWSFQYRDQGNAGLCSTTRLAAYPFICTDTPSH